MGITIPGCKLQPIVEGGEFDAHLLYKVGTRDGMKCIYKILKDGASKKEGLYYKETTASGTHIFNLGGHTLEVFPQDWAFNIYGGRHPRDYKYLQKEEEFVEVIKTTLVYFGVYEPNILNEGWTAPKSIDMTISEIEQEAIPSFGVF